MVCNLKWHQIKEVLKFHPLNEQAEGSSVAVERLPSAITEIRGRTSSNHRGSSRTVCPLKIWPLSILYLHEYRIEVGQILRPESLWQAPVIKQNWMALKWPKLLNKAANICPVLISGKYAKETNIGINSPTLF
jgi:hypothetical protein